MRQGAGGLSLPRTTWCACGPSTLVAILFFILLRSCSSFCGPRVASVGSTSRSSTASFQTWATCAAGACLHWPTQDRTVCGLCFPHTGRRGRMALLTYPTHGSLQRAWHNSACPCGASWNRPRELDTSPALRARQGSSRAEERPLA